MTFTYLIGVLFAVAGFSVAGLFLFALILLDWKLVVIFLIMLICLSIAEQCFKACKT